MLSFQKKYLKYKNKYQYLKIKMNGGAILSEDKSVNPEDDLQCVICLENITTGQSVINPQNCKHLFHLTCCNGLRQSKCPSCRSEIGVVKFYKLESIDNNLKFIENIAEQWNPAYLQPTHITQITQRPIQNRLNTANINNYIINSNEINNYISNYNTSTQLNFINFYNQYDNNITIPLEIVNRQSDLEGGHPNLPKDIQIFNLKIINGDISDDDLKKKKYIITYLIYLCLNQKKKTLEDIISYIQKYYIL